MKCVSKKYLNKMSILQYIVMILAIKFILISFILILIEKKVMENNQNLIEAEEKKIVQAQNELLANEISLIITDVKYLKEQFVTFTNEDNEMKYTYISKQWRLFADSKGFYDQVRFIDDQGAERIRINYNEDGSYIVNKEELQNKSERYYFNKTKELPADTIYVSKFDLNMEDSMVELPVKPIIRFATPVYSQDEFKGIIILNFLADIIIEKFETTMEYSNGELYLLNYDGEWLYSKGGAKEWDLGIVKSDKLSFKRQYPLEWRNIQDNNTSYKSRSGLFISNKSFLKQKISDKIKNNIVFEEGKWIVVSHISKGHPVYYHINDNVFSFLRLVVRKNYAYFFGILISSILSGILIYIVRRYYHKIRYLSEYDGLTKILNRRAGLDLLGKKLESINSMDKKALCFVDIDGLKYVNDTFGHDKGDEFIRSIVKCVKRVITENDLFIRLGGDEFIIVFDDVVASEAEIRWNQVEQEFNKVNNSHKVEYILSASHGIVEINKDNKDLNVLIKEADQKMYVNKLQRKKCRK